jgi:hypothetical protein
VPPSDPSGPSPWLESQRRSRSRRFAAARARRRRRSGRTALGVLAASLTVAAGGAVAQSGGTPAAPARTVSVATVQRALGITADGIAGPQTRRALKAFQRSHGLTADGIAGPATLAALGLGGSGRRAFAATLSPATVLARIARCESGGNPAAVSADGRYRGKYQFSGATWRKLGGTGDPAAAAEAIQDALAAKLYAARGTTPWPNCAF